MENVRTLLRKLEQGGADPALVEEVRELAETKTADAGIIRTNKGALMVRVGPSRWPIAMYGNDWKILLSKVPLIEEALATLDIPEENPEKQTGSSRSVQIHPDQRREAA